MLSVTHNTKVESTFLNFSGCKCDYYIAHTCYLPQVCLNTNYRSITCLKSNYFLQFWQDGNNFVQSIFTFTHLADAFIQSDLHCIQVIVFTFYQLLLSLGIEPMILALLAPCSTIWATGKHFLVLCEILSSLIFLLFFCVVAVQTKTISTWIPKHLQLELFSERSVAFSYRIARVPIFLAMTVATYSIHTHTK